MHVFTLQKPSSGKHRLKLLRHRSGRVKLGFTFSAYVSKFEGKICEIVKILSLKFSIYPL